MYAKLAKSLFFYTILLTCFFYHSVHAQSNEIENPGQWLKQTIEQAARGKLFGYGVSYHVEITGNWLYINQHMFLHPEKQFDMRYAVDLTQLEIGKTLKIRYHVKKKRLCLKFKRRLISMLSEHPDDSQYLIFDQVTQAEFPQQVILALRNVQQKALEHRNFHLVSKR
ncbi:hypothetical protein AAG747_23850 [Rapidithrix thailandica]|uniref:Uncharacterized protein n=1 Tax=Rapidithrix thailandica TaxID=413964 RepID=A0AAW9SJG1_9BACT